MGWPGADKTAPGINLYPSRFFEI